VPHGAMLSWHASCLARLLTQRATC
jgi:hypothetical protein